MFGQIGGYTALLWFIINTMFDGYESFRMTNSLIGNIYASTPQGPDASDCETSESAKKTLEETLTTGGSSWYSYS